MYRKLATKAVKQTGALLSNVAGKAFSNKYLLLTNLTVSAGMSASADGLVQKTCRHRGVGKYKLSDSVDRYGYGINIGYAAPLDYHGIFNGQR